jgi:hypothetical protein
LLLFFCLPNSTLAAGSFELVDFPETFNAVAGREFKTYINFIYSGTEYSLGVSITGNELPHGVKLGSIEYGANGVNSILLSGTPSEVSNYPLSLILTDNYGIMLTKRFNFNVNGLVFSGDALPNAVINKPYSTDVRFTYAGDKSPIIRIYDIPDSLYFDFTSITASKGSFTFRLTPRKVGTYTFKADATVSGIGIGTKIFSLTVNQDQIEPQVTTPIPIVETISPVVSVPVSKQTPAVVVPQKLNKEVVQEKPIVNEDEILEATSSTDLTPTQEQNIEPVAEIKVESVVKVKWYQKVFNWFKKWI